MFTYLIIACLVGLLGFIPFVDSSGANLVGVNDNCWWTDSDASSAPVRTLQISSDVTRFGSPSWEIPLSERDWGVDRGMFDVSAGDQLIFSSWIKTSEPTIENDVVLAGGRIGIDMYGDNGASFGISDTKGLGVDASVDNTIVVFGTDVWTKVTIEFVVPESYNANQVTNGQSIGTFFAPTGCCIWLQTWSCVYYSAEHGTAWFANPEFYIKHPSSFIDISGIGVVGVFAILSIASVVSREQLIKTLFMPKNSTVRQRVDIKNVIAKCTFKCKN